MSQVPATLFVFEGSDDVGKSTLARSLADLLRSEGRDVLHSSFPGRECAGSLGDLVYSFHHSRPEVDPSALQVAHVAAHIDSIRRRIRPALDSGKIVVLDRFWWSTVAYAEATGCDMAVVRAAVDAERVAWGGVEPSRIFLITRDQGKIAPPSDAVRARLDVSYSRLVLESAPTALRISNDLALSETLSMVKRQVDLVTGRGPYERKQ